MTRENSVHKAGNLLAAVEASPAAVAIHDKQAWVSLFADTGEVNDPVGSTPHVGAEAIGRFFDTFIAPNRIEFDVEHDVVAGMSALRDLTVRTTMPTGVTLYIPMHLRYDLVEDESDGSLKIQRLFAHWELQLMVAQMLILGRGGIIAAVGLGPQLLIKQGPRGTLGFFKGLLGVRETGKQRVQELAAALETNDLAALSGLFGPGATLSPDGVHEVGLDEFAHGARGLTADKLIACGRSVTSTIRIGDRRGLGLFEFSRNSAAPGTMSAARLYI
ncbi:nuclear transport factor 2 family protein [Mycobacterium sp. SM3041]|jgi:hypothetical protein|uniref:nuclear transport factor 2 family protein n=1 Tax=Mycobacterium sp. SM3041 TaxID=3114291 RepID=UPI003204DA94